MQKDSLLHPFRAPHCSLLVAIDSDYSRKFGKNKAGHPRSDVSFALSVQDAQLQKDILSKMPELPLPSLGTDVPNDVALNSVISRYAGSINELKAEMLRVAEYRDSLRPPVADTKMPGDVVKSDDEIIDNA